LNNYIAEAAVHVLAIDRQSQRQVRLYYSRRHWIQTKYAMLKLYESVL